TKVRHTFGSYHYFTDGVALSDDYVSGDFLTPELNVAVYEVKVTGSVDRRYSYECVADVENVDASKTRFISSGFYDVVTYYDDYDDNDKIYVLGEDIAADLKWTVARYGYGSHKQVDNEVELTKVEDVKFSDFILSFRKEDSKVSEVDWYNGLVGSLDEDDVTIHYTAICYADDWHFTQWYAYDFEVQPKATVVNKVTTALFPRIYDDYSPYVYRYRYEFAPATYWADYGELEIVVKTNYFMTDMPSAFEQCVGGYKATYLTAPQYDLNFELCTVSNPSYERPGVSFPFGVLAVPLIIGIALVVMGGIAGIAVTIAVAVKKS
ncbi:MAG: hypothetical protein K2N47_02230, partial [Clostridia bacterium]|nr:hypothetical protein [Clostridia bacterium]